MEEVRTLVSHAPITYQVEVNGTPITVQFTSETTLRIDGHTFHLDMSAIEGLPLYSLLLDNASYEVVVDEKDGICYALVRGQVHRIKVRDRATEVLPRNARAASVGETVIRAPMSGLLTEVLVTAGQAIEMNQVIMTLESMKMENEICSPCSGIVRTVKAQAGGTVREGDILAIVS